MNREILEINDFMVLLEQSASEGPTVEICDFTEPVIGMAFYGSGNVSLSIEYGDRTKSFENTKGYAMSFYANQHARFVHTISEERPLNCIVILSSINNLQKLPKDEAGVYSHYLKELVEAKDHFKEGPGLFMNSDMLNAVERIFQNSYSGEMRNLLLKSKVTELIAHFFGMVAEQKEQRAVPLDEREKIYAARDIISANIETPPTLDELAKTIGLNSYKLKKSFKELFGIPVFKHLQNERLNKANELLRNKQVSIQEAAWMVGYESLSSFSNAFREKFGFRPSEIKR